MTLRTISFCQLCLHLKKMKHNLSMRPKKTLFQTSKTNQEAKDKYENRTHFSTPQNINEKRRTPEPDTKSTKACHWNKRRIRRRKTKNNSHNVREEKSCCEKVLLPWPLLLLHTLNFSCPFSLRLVDLLYCCVFFFIVWGWWLLKRVDLVSLTMMIERKWKYTLAIIVRWPSRICCKNTKELRGNKQKQILVAVLYSKRRKRRIILNQYTLFFCFVLLLSAAIS